MIVSVSESRLHLKCRINLSVKYFRRFVGLLIPRQPVPLNGLLSRMTWGNGHRFSVLFYLLRLTHRTVSFFAGYERIQFSWGPTDIVTLLYLLCTEYSIPSIEWWEAITLTTLYPTLDLKKTGGGIKSLFLFIIPCESAHALCISTVFSIQTERKNLSQVQPLILKANP